MMKMVFALLIINLIVVPSSSSAFSSHTIEGLVPNGCVPEMETFDRDVVAFRRDPAVFRQSMMEWDAVKKWKSFDYLIERMGQRVLRIQHSRRSLFAYDVIKPLTRMETIHRSLKWSRDDDVFMNLATFLEDTHKHDDHYYYIMASLDTNADFKDLARDIMPNEFLRLDMGHEITNELDVLFRKHSTIKRPVTSYNSSGSLNIAMSGNGVSVRSHYDASHNFLVQITGTKRLLLLPPNSVKMYPETHPSHRQIQPLSTSPPHVLEAVLEPGDMIYIPPFWIHHVDYTKELGVSVNVWSQAEERQHTSRAQQISDATLKDLPLSALKPFLFRVMKRALRGDDDDVIAFLKTKVLEHRYDKIGPQFLKCKSAYDRPGQCESLVTREGLLTTQCAADSKGDKIGQILSLIIQIDRNVHVRDLLLADYVERTVRTRLTGEATKMGLRNPDVLGRSWVCPFLRCVVDQSWAAVSSKT